MRLVFFTFYYPPDLCAGSFRAVALTEALSGKLKPHDEIHVITTHPNRYSTYKVKAESNVIDGNIQIHRIHIPVHKSGMLSQAHSFLTFAWHAFFLCRKIQPDFIIGTTSRLMTGVLTRVSASAVSCQYFIDLRDIFSETISDIFALKSKLLGRVVKRIFSFIEKPVFVNASGVNVVSLGFPAYFETLGINTDNWSFYPNGVDSEFIGLPRLKNGRQNNIKTILYAGNIGSGQGLEKIIPAVAKKLGEQYLFLVVGDGGRKRSLEVEIEAEDIKNINLLPPVGRTELIKYYEQADMLFLHLNDLPAFKRVLPSKIFEYAALGKPVIAGLSGYSARFVDEQVKYGCVFPPGDVDLCVACIENITEKEVPQELVDEFVSKYSRGHIMDEMSKHILLVAKGSVKYAT